MTLYLGSKELGKNVTLKGDTLVKLAEISSETNGKILSNNGVNTVWTDEQIGYKQITNCLTEIPQDIKLELTNGTLTLKAGSKVYIPNGFEEDGTTKKFDTKTISNDISVTPTEGEGQFIFYTNTNASSMGWRILSGAFSGTSDPESATTTYYNTVTNIIIAYNISGDVNVSLPIAICTLSNGTITSIDQVFNGIGYIGSTIFATPGVKGLAPNGRNKDGTLNNILFTTSTVSTHTSTSSYSGKIGFNRSNAAHVVASSYTGYDSENNYNLDSNGNRYNYAWCGTIAKGTGGKFTSFKPNTAIHLLDRNDKEEIVGWGMPDYSAAIAISSFPYTAPSDGIIFVNYSANDNNQMSVNNVVVAGGNVTSQYGQSSRQNFLIKKDDIAVVSAGTFSNGIFVPLKGVN